MMINKALHYKPDIAYSTQKSVRKKKTTLKEKLKEFLVNLCFLFLILLNIVAAIGVAYKSYIYFSLKKEFHKLKKENEILVKKYQYITSKDVVLKKAKKLGLRPPEKGDYIELKW